MRQSTLVIICYILVFPAVYFLPAMADAFGYAEFPRWSLVGNALATLVASGVMSFALRPLNDRLLDYRKAHGRDIRAEENHETTSGVIRLTPNDD